MFQQSSWIMNLKVSTESRIGESKRLLTYLQISSTWESSYFLSSCIHVSWGGFSTNDWTLTFELFLMDSASKNSFLCNSSKSFEILGGSFFTILKLTSNVFLRNKFPLRKFSSRVSSPILHAAPLLSVTEGNNKVI